ncbi:hypothetical protein LEP1GSC032_0821 [Leptospira interrogans str. 2002000631]|nr:hypothetical protein LEP1GSC032_0821 [Leptospira interrogans str. 2002000631]
MSPLLKTLNIFENFYSEFCRPKTAGRAYGLANSRSVFV